MITLTSEIRSILYVKLTGRVNQAVLELMCDELDMEVAGRLDDGYDQLFGERLLRPEEQGEYCLELYRDTDTEWSMMVSAEPPLPSRAEVIELERLAFEVARKANLTPEEVYLRHVE